MKQSDPAPADYVSPLPAGLLLRLAGLPELFTRPTWCNALLLLTGAILAPGKRTVTAALRILGREQETDFPIYHGVLNRAVWSSRAVAGWLLRLLVASLLGADATVVIGLDDTIERRWGHKINARGIYRDPVRSSKGHFVKTSGLRWLSAQLLVHIPWAGRVMGLPFLTMLAPSKRFYADTPRAPKTLLDWARQAALQIHRWLPGRRIVIVGDTALAAIGFLAAVRGYLSVVTRLRLDANLYAPAPPRRRRRGRPPIKGKRLAKLGQVLHDPRTIWHRHTVTLWYGRTNRIVELATGTAVWYHSGLPPVPIRWLLVRDPLGELQPQAFLFVPISTPLPSISSSGSSPAGSLRSPSRMPAPISASKLNASGPTSPFCAPPRRCLACSRWSPSGRMTSPPTGHSLPLLPPGTRSHTALSAMPSPPCVDGSGIIRVLACPGVPRMSSKFPANYGNARQTHSPMPRNSIKSSLVPRFINTATYFGATRGLPGLEEPLV